MQWILVLIIFGNEPNNAAISMTSISGFLTYGSCTATGIAWQKTKQTYERVFECLPADQK
jgi:hypothetical protein